MRGLITTITVLALCLGTAWAERPPVISPTADDFTLFDNSPPTGQVVRGVGPGLQAGADEIIADQCPAGGWNWPHGGCSATYTNLNGPIGMGLLHAYASTSDPDHLAAAVAAGNYEMTSAYGNGEYRAASFSAAFLYRLTHAGGGGAYSDWVGMNFFDELTAKTYGPSDWDTYGWIAVVEAARSGAYINMRPWEFQYLPWVAGLIGNTDSTTPLDGVSQQTAFLSALLAGLDTLDRTSPGSVWWDMFGLAGGVHGLALNGTTSFAAISAPKFAPINGLTMLKDLADVLAGYQNADGSWYWSSNLSAPDETDKDTQTTAYAVMALVAADPLVASDYSAQIAKGRDWLRSMQLPDGGFLSYPGGDQNIEVEAEALNALAPDPCTQNKLVFEVPAASLYAQPGETIAVELWQRNVAQPVRGFQGFAQFDSSALTNPTHTLTATPYPLHILNNVTGDNIDLAAGVNYGDPAIQYEAKLADLTFTAGATQGPTFLSFRYHDPPSRFTGEQGQAVTACLVESPPICIDATDPVITCPDDKTVDNDTGFCSARVNVGTKEETFDNTPPLSTGAAQGYWYVDRYRPAGFANSFFDGDYRLRHSVSSADFKGHGNFYATQGRKYDVDLALTATVTVDIYIPAEWETHVRRADLWGTVFDTTGGVGGYPIVGFTSADPDYPSEYPGTPTPRFRCWKDDDTDYGWVDMGLPSGFAYDQWYTLTFEVTPTAYIYTVIGSSGTLTYTFTYPSVRSVAKLGNVMLQVYNFGESHDVYWDNVTLPAAATDGPCDGPVVITYVRSDNPALTLGDPFPVGTTTITWTATDMAGNDATCEQDIAVADTESPAISGLSVTGGNVDADCEYTVTFGATLTDNCCLSADDVDVSVVLLTGNATLGTPSAVKTQVDSKMVSVSGSVLVSDLTSCPATVQVTIDASDCYANAATPAVDTADVYDVTPPEFSSGVPFGETVLAGGNATSSASGPWEGGAGTIYTASEFVVIGAPTFNGAWGDSDFGDFAPIPPANNGGQLYVGTDGSNVTLRVMFTDVDLSGINNAPELDPGQGHLGIMNVGGSGFGILPNRASVLAFDMSENASDPADVNRHYCWQSWQQADGFDPTGEGPDSGWNMGPKGGGTGNPEYDTFDAMLEFVPQPDGTVRLYMFERKHLSLNGYLVGGPDDNGTMLWRPHHFGWMGVNRFYNILPAPPYMGLVNVFAGVTNGSNGSSGGAYMSWGDIYVYGSGANALDPCYPTQAAAETAALAAAQAAASDNCTAAVDLDFDVVTNGTCSAAITVTVTDQCDNSSDITYTTRIDNTPPVVTAPGDVDVNADAGLCTAEVTWTAATATDNCDGDLSASVLYDIDVDNDGTIDATQSGTTYTFPGGIHKVIAKATDTCGNTGNDDFLVTVSAYNELVVDVELSPTMVAGPITRCITFELWKCPDTTPDAVVDELMTFTSGQTGSVTVLVPCGDYTCITARDKLHTLRRTDAAFAKVGTQWVADFTGDPTSGGDWLIGGNLNDDYWIDILDFGVFSWQWNTNYGTGDTTCSTTFPHADINGNGVVFTEDFTFIQINFLKSHEANCCGQPGFRGEESEPITSISVAELIELGLGELAAGDINGDGWLDAEDMAAFAGGGSMVHVGDLNCDGAVDFGDINPFVLALTNPAAWQQAYPNCNPLNGDANQDGVVDFGDINPFIALLQQQ